MRYDYSMEYKEQTLEQLLIDYGANEVSALDVYSDVFDLGYGFIQRTGEYHVDGGELKANPIILGRWGDQMKRRILLEDTFAEQLQEFQQADWAILNGLTYFGRANTANAQSYLCALMFDLDGITPKSFNNFLHAAFADAWNGHGAYPIPNYVIMSGTNVHLYYLLETPVALYPNVKQELKKLKYALTRLIWNQYTSDIKNPQYQGLNQGFRVIGGKTKHEGVFVRAFWLNKHPFSIEGTGIGTALNDYVNDDNKAQIKSESSSKYTLAEAKKLFPEWYERIVVNNGERKVWQVKEDLYNWWLRKLQNVEGVTFGHRYFCVMTLAVFAAKCGILDKERVKKDAMALIPIFNKIEANDPFTEHDIKSALDCLDLRYATFPRADLEKITAISMPANKRNRRKQAVHLAGARAIQRINDEVNGTNWRDGNSRKGSPNKKHPKKDLIIDYKKGHPTFSNRRIAQELNVSRNTVNKWLKNCNVNENPSVQ